MYDFILCEGSEVARKTIETAGKVGTKRMYGSWNDPITGMIPMPLLFNLLTVALVGIIFWWILRSSKQKGISAIEILNRRYASGEIDEKQYHKIKKDII